MNFVLALLTSAEQDFLPFCEKDAWIKRLLSPRYIVLTCRSWRLASAEGCQSFKFPSASQRSRHEQFRKLCLFRSLL